MHYLNNPEKLDSAISKSPEDQQIGFKLFPLDPIEQDIVTNLSEENSKRRFSTIGGASQSLQKPKDIKLKFMDPKNRYARQRILSTQELLENLSVLNFRELRNQSSDVVRERSHELINRLCDKDQTYYKNEMDEIKQKIQNQLKSKATKSSIMVHHN